MKIYINKFFHPLFFLLFLLSFFLIEENSKFYIFTIWILFFVFFNFYQKRKSENVHLDKFTTKPIPLSVLLSLILALAAAIDVVFSSNLPLSLEKLSFYMTAVAFFIFFHNLKQKILQINLFFYYLSIIAIVLNFFVLLFTFTNFGAELFTNMNLFIRNYGHNHYSAFLLLLLPVFWWQLFFSKDEVWATGREIRLIAVLLLFSSYLLVILSLARVAMFFSLLQLITIFFLNKKELLKSIRGKFYQVLVKSFISAFSTIIGLFLVLSLSFINQQSQNFCPLLFSHKELCKPLMQDDRQRYWQKAWLVFSDKPLFGSGLKTFNFSSRKFPMANYTITSYAHNIFLHNLAEGGLLFGGFFICYIFYLFYAGFIRVKFSVEPLDKFLYLAAVTSLLNAMFDYDWNFFIIFSLTLIFLAIILRHANEPLPKFVKNLSKKFFKLVHIFFLSLLFWSVLASGIFFSANLLLNQDKIDILVKYFPFVSNVVRHAIVDKKLSAKHFSELSYLYRFDPYFISELVVLDDVSQEQKVSGWLALAKLDPLFFIDKIDLSKFTLVNAKPLADELMQIAKKYNFIGDANFLNYWRQKKLSASMANLANEAYLASEVDSSASFYQDALLFDKFVLGDVSPVFLKETNLDISAQFLLVFAAPNSFDPDLSGEFYDYLGLYQKTLLHLFKQNRLDDFFVLAQAMFDKQYNFSWFLWRDLIAASKTPTDRDKLEKIHDHFKDMTTWNDFWPLKK